MNVSLVSGIDTTPSNHACPELPASFDGVVSMPLRMLVLSLSKGYAFQIGDLLRLDCSKTSEVSFFLNFNRAKQSFGLHKRTQSATS